MSIPLDHLYHYLESLNSDDILIYRWFPHGSKKVTDLLPIKHTDAWVDRMSLPILVAHDQEPLDYELLYSQPHYYNSKLIWVNNPLYQKFLEMTPSIRSYVGILNIYDKFLLCHSEKNSKELNKFDNDFIGVYYWSHAIISRDWFRYAKHDKTLKNNPSDYKFDFLIYNRAWSGTREYRLKLLELLSQSTLENYCLTSFSPLDNEIHYTSHHFKNQNLKINTTNLESLFPPNTYSPTASASYVSNDYNTSGIEIVLETLFDDSRNHLTEKTLRPIACGKPFILASTPNSLQYLREYGFKTFSGLIDESYDAVVSPVDRLNCIVNEMRRISNLPLSTKTSLFAELNAIAAYNKNLFFSEGWQEGVISEFTNNLADGLSKLTSCKTGKYWNEFISVASTDVTSMRWWRSTIHDKTANEVVQYEELIKNLHLLQ